jgi:hypothetical protein
VRVATSGRFPPAPVAAAASSSVGSSEDSTQKIGSRCRVSAQAFEKRTRKTPPQELKLARDRYRALMKEKRADDAKNK